MRSLVRNPNLRQGQFNTLAQSVTTKNTKPQLIVYGKGSDLTDLKALKNQSKKKMITQSVVLGLLKVAELKGNKEMRQQLWNTYHCHSKPVTSNGRRYGNYCKNRFCTVCCGNRKAEMIKKYLPVLETWTDPQFVTLTVQAVPARGLKKRWAGVMRAFREIERKLRMQNRRGKGIKLVGIKSTESNFNATSNTYNPHLHLIVQTKEMAEVLVKEWLAKWTKKFALPVAQKIKTISNKEKILIEVIKYGTKIFTEPDPNNKKAKAPRKIYLAAMYNILVAMQGMRVFDRFGFNLPKGSGSKPKKSIVKEFEKWEHNPKINDWENGRGQTLTKYLPDAKLIDLLMEMNIDKE